MKNPILWAVFGAFFNLFALLSCTEIGGLKLAKSDQGGVAGIPVGGSHCAQRLTSLLWVYLELARHLINLPPLKILLIRQARLSGAL